MIHYPDLVQGSPEWAMARAGRPCSSEFHKILTAGGKPSKQVAAYAYKLLAELMIGEPIQTFESTYWIDRGKTLEADAVSLYEFKYGWKTQKAGFCMDDNKRYGASPDRFVGDFGLAEFKVPAPHTHMEYLRKKSVDDYYKAQLNGQMFITGRQWVDIFSYHPEMPPVAIRVDRDEEYIGKLEIELEKLREFMNHEIEEMIANGEWRIEEKEPENLFMAG